MNCQIPVTLLLADDEASITACLLAQMQRTPFVGALLFTTAAFLGPIPSATVISVPLLQWLAMPSCLFCMSPTDPRLILLRALDTGVGEPRRPVDCIVFAVPASLSASVQRAMTSIAPLTDRLASLRIIEGSSTKNGRRCTQRDPISTDGLSEARLVGARPAG